MAEERIKFIIDAQNRADAAFKEVKKGIGGVQEKLESMQPTFSKMAKWGTVGFGAITAGAMLSVKAAAENEGAWNKFNVVFGEHAEDMGKWIKDVRKRLPSATTDVVKMASGVQDLLIPMGFARDEAMGMTQETIELANALAAFNDVPVEQVIDAMISGFSGMTRPLKQFGIDIPIERLEQMAIAEGIVTNGFKELDFETRRTVQAQMMLKAAYEDSGDALAGFEDNQDSFIRRSQEMKASIADAFNVIGDTLLPIFDDALKKILPLIEGFSKWAEKNPELARNTLIVSGAFAALVAGLGILGLMLPGIITALSVAGPYLVAIAGLGAAFWYFKDSLVGVYNSMKNNEDLWIMLKAVAVELWESIKGLAVSIWEALKPAFEDIKEAIEPILPTLKFLGIAIGVVLVGSIFVIIKVLELFLKIAIKVVVGIVKYFSGFIQFIQGLFEMIAGLIIGLITGDFTMLMDGARNVVDGLIGMFEGLWDVIKGIFKTIFDWIVGIFTDLFSILIGESIIPDMIEAIIKAFTDWGKSIKEIFTGAWDAIVSVTKGAIELLMDKIQPFIDAFEKVKSGAGWLGEKAGGAVSWAKSKLMGGNRFGGEIPRTGNYLLHKGEEVVPAGSATGEGITINILGGNYLSREAGLMLGDQIVEELKRRLKL